MRGTPSASPTRPVSHRIIPAHAGNTDHVARCHDSYADHPRTCGEHKRCPRKLNERKGSSPHMRGTQRPWIQSYSKLRIIPAHAGNTRVVAFAESADGDHPRTCGEHTSRLAQYRGFLIRSVCFLFSFILSTSLPAGTYWHCSIHDEEHRQKTLPSYWMAV